MSQKVGVGIVGHGPAGDEMTSILSARKRVKIVDPGGGNIRKIMKKIQYALLALPVTASMRLTPEFLDRGITVIDFSGAFRLQDPHVFEKYYGLKHTCPQLIEKAVYGLTEKNAGQIQGATLIANPGCYATAIILSLLPLAENGIIAPDAHIHVNAISGFSGGGKHAVRPKRTTRSPYKETGREDRGHQHVPEIEQALKLDGQIHFYPRVGTWFRGIEVEILMRAPHRGFESDMAKFYSSFYKKYPCVQIVTWRPTWQDVECTNICLIFPSIQGEQLKIFTALDNLRKGAAGQVMQNLILMNPQVFGRRVYENE